MQVLGGGACLSAVLPTLATQDPVPPTQALTRAALESAARGWWLLDPDVDSVHRVARFEAEWSYGLRQKRSLVLGDRSLLRAADADIARNKARFRSLGLPSVMRPTSTNLVGELLTPPGGTAVVGQMFYRLFSGWPHASVHVLLSRIELVDSPLKTAQLGVLGVLNAFDRLADHVGWDAQDDWRSWASRSWSSLVAELKDSPGS